MSVPLAALVLTPAFLEKPPNVGDRAPGFDVRTLDHKAVRLSDLKKRGPVVLVVLRGYPGYQCPICNVQVGEILAKSAEIEKREARVVLIYPGPTEGLDKHAEDFISGRGIPKVVSFALDPDYRFTESYGLRWNAPNETAYPSTFVIGRDGKVAYAKVSRTHGDRAPFDEVLRALDRL